jgi:hypothetical protein
MHQRQQDQMIGGFALVAYLAQDGSAGVMTFLFNQEGRVFEKDPVRTSPASPAP